MTTNDEEKDHASWSEFVTSLIQAVAIVTVCAVGGLTVGLLYGVLK